MGRILLIFFILPFFGYSQNSITLAFCQCPANEIMTIISIAKFYGYKFENHLIKEIGISEYTSSLKDPLPPSSTSNLEPKLIIINYNSGENKKIILVSNLDRIEKNFELVNREYYSKDVFLALIRYEYD